MKLTIPFREQLSEVLRNTLDAIVARINIVWAKEHNSDGTHKLMTERGRSVAIGDWIAVPYSQANFTASAGTWTVDLADHVTFQYMVIGHTLWVTFTFIQTNVSNAGASLRITFPGGFVAAKTSRQYIRVIDAGAAGAAGMALITAGTSYIECFTSPASAGFALTAANNTNVAGVVCLEIS